MDTFLSNKKTKKFIIILAVLLLFSFCCPNQVKAFDFEGNISSFLFFLERGVIRLLNNTFCDETHNYVWDPGNGNIQVYLSAESIIKGNFILFDANIFENLSNSTKDYYDKFDWLVGADGAKTELRATIAGWYYNLFNFTIVALLSVLVYVGIRMITSTISQDKAKYKIMFKDWLVAICILVMMHYMMIGILNVTSMITEALGGTGEESSQVEDIMALIYNINNKVNKGSGDVRHIADDGTEYTIGDAFAYELLLLCILIITGVFIFKYLKREFTIIFLILLGPISCITYPIDKISDGKAQAFNKWLSEFIYNVLVQPFHLLLFLVLVGSATELADNNIIYAIICLAILIPAEKFVKEMFGFKDKLGSPLGAMATGALAGQVMSKMMSGGKSGGKIGGNAGGDNSSTENQLPIKTLDDKDLADGAVEGAAGGLAGHAVSEGADDEIGIGDSADERLNAAEGEEEEIRQFGEGFEDEIESNDNLALGEGTEESDEGLNLSEGDNDTAENPSDATESNSAENESSEEEKPKRTFKSMAKGTYDFAKSKGKQALDIHSQRMAKKWGSTNRGRRWVNRGKKLLGGTAKFAVRAGATALGTAALGTFGLMVGQGAKGALAGAALGSSLGNKAIKSFTETGSDYFNGMRNNKGIDNIYSNENKAFNDFRGDRKQQDKAVLSYRKAHNGVNPSSTQLDQEIRDRYELSRFGLSDSEIDDCLVAYQNKEQQLLEDRALGAGLSQTQINALKDKAGGVKNLDGAKYRSLLEKELKSKDKQGDISKAKEIAASQAKYTANLASAYSGKDFRDSKVMATALGRITERLDAATGCGSKVAENYAREYLINAADMKGISKSEIALPGETVSVDIDLPRQSDVITTFEIPSSSSISSAQIERINQVTVNLRKAGLSKEEILMVSSSCAGEDVTEVIDRYETKVNYLSSGSAVEQAKITIESSNNGRNASASQVRAEMKERLILSSTFNVDSEEAISELREVEQTQLRDKSQVQVAREFASRNRGRLNDTGHMASEREGLVKKLINGGSSETKAKKDADNIINLASRYNNEPIRGISSPASRATKRTSTVTDGPIKTTVRKSKRKNTSDV